MNWFTFYAWVKFSNHRKFYEILIIGLVVHIIILLSVFDIYFGSPIEHGMQSVLSTTHPPAERLVLMVTDGLRAKALFGDDSVELRAPYLTSLRRSRASWGYSHTRVPTESRPGHVAILGGIYEDPRAILKGWQANPVDFDSVINQSRSAWCWGSPEIINLFNKDNLPHIHMHSYDAGMEDFAMKNTTHLDVWVFDKFEEFLKQHRNCSGCKPIKDNGSLYFLHLLGIDTAGHGYKPYSEGYKANIELVDRKIESLEKIVENIFPPKTTAYIVTSDHGMTDWGSHGSGTDDETVTPFIAWGAGIKEDNYPKNISQIDIAPLISSLIGINFPLNSMGRLPYRYLSLSFENLYKLLINNLLQIMQIFNAKQSRIEKGAIFFTPYLERTVDSTTHDLKQIGNKVGDGLNFDFFVKIWNKHINVVIAGLDYYQNYYKVPLLAATTLGFVLWLCYLILYFSTEELRLNLPTGEIMGNNGFTFTYSMLILLCFVHYFSITYYVYFLFPLILFQLLYYKLDSFQIVFDRLKTCNGLIFLRDLILFTVGVELMVFGFYYRICYSILPYLMALWLYLDNSYQRSGSYNYRVFCICCCCLLSIFPVLPVMNTKFDFGIYFSGVTLLAVILFFLMQYLSSIRTYKILLVQYTIFLITPIYTYLIEFDVIENDSLTKIFSWFLFVVPIILVPFTDSYIYMRLTSILLGFLPFYLMVSFNYECLFITVYALMLMTWLLFEEQRIFPFLDPGIMVLDSDHFRRAFFFVIAILVGFFGTGNVASLNSFDPMWVRCFITVFSPFTMALLILMKLIVPFILAGCVFRTINTFSGSSLQRMFCIVLLFSDIMVLHFMYLITNIGSWLDIGMSLSHFIIMEVFVVVLLLLYGVAYFLISARLSEQSIREVFKWKRN